MKLRSVLFALAMSTAAPLVLLFIVSAVYVYKHDTGNIVDAALARNGATLEAVDAEIRGSMVTLRSLASSAALARGDIKAFHDESRIILGAEPLWRNIILSAAGGEQLSSARFDWGTPLRLAAVEPRSLATAISTGQPTIGSLASPSENPGNSGVPVRWPIVNNGRTTYVITAVLRPEAFQDILSRQRLPGEWVSGIVGTDGRLIARVPTGIPGTAASADYLKATKAAKEGWYRGKTLEGEDTYTAFSRSSLTGWSIGYAMPANVILGGARRAAYLLVVGLMLSVACGLSLSIWLTKRVTGAVNKITEAAQSIGTDRSIGVPISNIREIDGLAHAIDITSASVHDRDVQLLKSKAELERQAVELRDKDDNRSRFLALLSHELRNPLAPLRTGLGILKLRPDETRRAATEAMMNRQITHLTRLIDDLLDIGRIDRGQIELKLAPTDLLTITRHAIEAVESAVTARKHQLTIVMPQEPIWINGDPVRLEQIIGNVLTNAIKYTPAGGRVALEISELSNLATLSVSDSGIGFDRDERDRLFEMFTRLPNADGEDAGGLGIGLSLAKALVELHGGEISADSSGNGKGATFTIQLPITGRPPDRRSDSTIREKLTARVVIADDNTDAAESLAEFLRLQGATVHVARDGMQAIELIRSVRPTVSLIDINMPLADGYEVARRLRDEGWTEAMALIALTGMGQQDDRRLGQSAGFDLHVVKPVDVELLSRLVAMSRAELLAFARSNSEAPHQGSSGPPRDG